MCLSYVDVKVYGRDESMVSEVKLLVDSGSIYTWINKATLLNLQITSKGSKMFRTIEGKTIRREIGEAVIEYEGERATTIVVFANENDTEVLGVVALESLGLEIDPITKKLKKAEILLAV